VETEGNRPRSCRLGPQPDLASRRYGSRTGAARLQLLAAQEDDEGRVALGAVCQGSRRGVEGRFRAFTLGDHKTKAAMGTLAKLEAGRTVLVIDNGENKNLTLGLRNLKGVTLMPTREVNPYHLLGHKTVFLSEAAARKFSEALAK